MYPHPLRLWLTAGAVGAVITAGCGRSARQSCDCVPGPYQTYSTVAAAPAPPAGYNAVATVAPAAQPAPAVVTAPAPVPEHTTLKVEHGFGPVIDKDAQKRRTFVDITAKPQFAHADDHSWLVGELQFDRARKNWRLRYATVDEEDRYGGSVTLDGERILGDAKAGDVVKIEGVVVDAEATGPAPVYRVRNATVVRAAAH